MAQWVESLLNIHEALGLIPSVTQLECGGALL